MSLVSNDEMRRMLAPERCALLIVDVQNDYIHPEGAFSRMGHNTAALMATAPLIKELIELARKADLPRIYIRQTHSDWFNTPGWLGRGRGCDTLPVERIPLVQEGTWGAEFYELEPQSDELVITKHRYDGFQYTPLELALHAKKRDTVILCGGTTDCCVRATGVGAVTRGFHPILVSDCAATELAGSYETSLREFAQNIGNVLKLEMIRSVWTQP